MVNYDAAVIVQYANGLYKKAHGMIAAYTALGALLMGISGGLLAMLAIAPDAGAAVAWGLLAAMVGAVVGFMLGESRAFYLKLLAELALCLASIEANTAPPPAARDE